MKKNRWTVLIFLLLFAVALWGPTVYANLTTRDARYNLGDTPAGKIPKRSVALVFGAGVLPNGEPTPYLQLRVETAIELYEAGRVQKIVMSGDNSTENHNEPVVMGNFAVELGVPREDIVLDYAGFNTYDSCYRAKAIFNVKDAILVTQGYHLPRAVMTCSELGIDSIGVAARRVGRDFTVSYIMREWLSTNKAMIQLVTKPESTVLGDPEPI